MTDSEASSTMADESEREICQQCSGVIDGKPLFPWTDMSIEDGSLVIVDSPDGPFCDWECRRGFDGR